MITAARRFDEVGTRMCPQPPDGCRLPATSLPKGYQMLDDLIDINDPALLTARLSEERAPDIVEALNEATPERAAALLLLLPAQRAVDVLDQPGLKEPAEIIVTMPTERAVALLDGVSADRLADIFRALEEPTRANLLGKLDADTASALRELLT